MSRIASTFTKRMIMAGTLALGGFASTELAAAQEAWDNLEGEFFGYVDLTVPLGDFRNHVALGGGMGAGCVLFLDENRLAGLRAEGGFVIYGGESQRVSFSSTVPLVEVEQRTTNHSIVSGGLGPQVYLGNGLIRPYVYGTVGIAYFVTSSSVTPLHSDETIASSTNFDDFQLSLSGGGGLSVEIRGGQNPLSLNLSASYQHNGLTQYLIKGAEHLDARRGGGFVARPITSDANLMTYRVGVSVGLG